MENFRLLSSKDLRNKATVLITGLFVALNFIQIILENLLSINSYVINLISHYSVLFAVMLFLLHLTKNYPLDRCFYLLSLLSNLFNSFSIWLIFPPVIESKTFNLSVGAVSSKIAVAFVPLTSKVTCF